MAPILSFTAEEAWRVLYPDDATIFAHVWKTEHGLGAVPDLDALMQKWSHIVEVRREFVRRRRDPGVRMTGSGTRLTTSRRWWLWLVLSAAIVVADQATKALVLSTLRPGEE